YRIDGLRLSICAVDLKTTQKIRANVRNVNKSPRFIDIDVVRIDAGRNWLAHHGEITVAVGGTSLQLIGSKIDDICELVGPACWWIIRWIIRCTSATVVPPAAASRGK